MSEEPLTPEEESHIGSVDPKRSVHIDAKLHYRFQKEADIIGITVDQYVDRLLKLTLKGVPSLEKLVLISSEAEIMGIDADFMRDLYNETPEADNGN